MELPTLLTSNRREPTDEPSKDAEEDAFGTNILGSAVKSLVRSFDASALGVKVDVGELEIDVLSGKISVDNLLVRNPEGYYSEYLLRAGKMIVDVDLQVLLTSAGRTVEVQEVDFQDVDVIYETGLTTSNIDDVMKNLQSIGPGLKEKESAAPASTEPEVILHKVSILNFGAKAASTLTRGLGPRFVMADVVYQDFNKEMGSGRGMVDAISIVMQSLLFTAMGTCESRKTARRKKTRSPTERDSDMGAASKGASVAAGSAGTEGTTTADAAMEGLRSMATAFQKRLAMFTNDPALGDWTWLAPCRICQADQRGELVVDQTTAEQTAASTTLQDN